MTDPSQFSIRTTTRGPVSVISVSGDVDIAQAIDLRRAVSEVSGPVVVDLHACGFIGSDGLRSLLEGRRLAAEREDRFVLSAADDGMVARLLAAVGGRTIFNVETELEAAVALAATKDRRYGGERRRQPPMAA